MKDILQDIVDHTNKLGFLNIVKVTTTDGKTCIDSITDDRSVIMSAETKEPQEGMDGVFGMPQLDKLRYLLECREYQEDAQINIVYEERNGETMPVGLHFENKDGDFKNDYRFMKPDIISERIKPVKFRGAEWDVVINPTVSAQQRFQFQAAANSEHSTFLPKTDKDSLKFLFGDAASHGGEFTFATDVSGKLKKSWTYPVMPVLQILKITDTNNATIKISDGAVMLIELDSGLAVYKYYIPAQT